MLKRQPSTRDRRHNCSAFLTASIDVPAIDPDRSTTKKTSAGAVWLPNTGRSTSAAAVPRWASRSTTTWGAWIPSASMRTTTSRSSAVAAWASVTVAEDPVRVTSIGCEGEATRPIAPGMAKRSVRSSPYGTVQASGGDTASAGERPIPRWSAAGA